jgi:predicted MPP superfamily phosphohydrolase
MVLFPIVLFLLVIEGLIMFGHFLVYSALISAFHISGRAQNITWWLFAILSVSFLVTSLITNAVYSPLLKPIYAASAIWLGTLYWLVFSSVIYFIILGLASIFSFTIPQNIIGSILFLVGILVSGYGLYHAEQTQITRYTVKIKNLPEIWQGKNIALVADTHLGDVRNLSFDTKIAKLINSQHPEMVLVAGDFYDGPPVNFEELAQNFAHNINAPKGIYYANGNHEQFSDNSKYTNALSSANIHVLKNTFTVIDGLQIAGVDYNNTTNYENTKKTLADIKLDPVLPTILIKHAPMGLQAVAEKGIDLQVSGHTHQGQVWPGSWLTSKIFGKFAYGLQTTGSLQVITTSGAGTWGPPQRVGTNAEIVVITLQKD